MKEIKKSLKDLNLSKLPKIICEPGRAIVAESGSTIVRVNLRKNINYILTMVLTDLYLTQEFQILFYHQE